MSPFTLRPLAAAIGLVLAMPAWAQQNAADNDAAARSTTTLSPIITRALANERESAINYTTPNSTAATGLNLSLRETPQSVSVVTARQIEDQGTTTVDETLALLPGVFHRTWGNRSAGYNSYLSRGYEIDNYLIDGANLFGFDDSQSKNNTDSAIYESINFVRGATGLASGIGDPGGVIEFVRKKPTVDRRASLEVGAGSWRHYRTMLDASGALNDDHSLRGRVVVALDDGGEWQRRAKQHRGTFWGVLEYDLAPATLLTVGLQHDQERSTGSSMHSFNPFYGDLKNGFRPMPFGPRDNASARWAYRNAHRTELSTRLEHELANGWHVNARYSYATGENRQLYGIAGTFGVQSDGSARLVGGYWEHAPKEHILDLSVTGDYAWLGRGQAFKLGLSYNHMDDFDTPQFDREIVPVANIFTYDGTIDQPVFTDRGRGGDKKRMASLYGVTNVYFTDRWSVLLGTRLVNWKSSNRMLYNDFATVEQKESAIFTPYLGTVLKLNGWLSAYGSYSTIFKPQENEDINRHRLDPEEGAAIELGLKGQWMDGKLNAAASVFQTRKDNVASQAGRRDDGTSYYVAVDGAKARGVELMVQGEPRKGWLLTAGYTHVRSKDAEGRYLDADWPVNMFTLSSSHDLTDRFTVGGDLQWQSKMLGAQAYDIPDGATAEDARIINEADTQKAYALVNLSARYRFDRHLSVRVNLGNVFDKRYRTSASSLSFGAPRNIMATLRYDF